MLTIEIIKPFHHHKEGDRLTYPNEVAYQLERSGYGRRVKEDATEGNSAKAIVTPPRDKAVKRPRRAKSGGQ